MNRPAGRPAEPTPEVARYKTILRDVLDRRPSGMRKRLAEALGKNRSFVSQIANPAYATPIPAVHVEAILDLCRFSATEREAFVAAYAAAHPSRPSRSRSAAKPPLPPGAKPRGEAPRLRTLSLRVPDLGDDRRNRELERLVNELVGRILRIVEPPG